LAKGVIPYFKGKLCLQRFGEFIGLLVLLRVEPKGSLLPAFLVRVFLYGVGDAGL
jgi:hypothetical protein